MAKSTIDFIFMTSDAIRNNWELLQNDPDFGYGDLEVEQFMDLALSGRAVVLGFEIVIQNDLPMINECNRGESDEETNTD